jgi:hypothetical protein
MPQESRDMVAVYAIQTLSSMLVGYGRWCFAMAAIRALRCCIGVRLPRTRLMSHRTCPRPYRPALDTTGCLYSQSRTQWSCWRSVQENLGQLLCVYLKCVTAPVLDLEKHQNNTQERDTTRAFCCGWLLCRLDHASPSSLARETDIAYGKAP